MHKEETTEIDHGCVVLYVANIMANFEDHGYAKVCVDWVSRRLINAHKDTWKTTATNLLH
jgi:hypothetical protein